MIKKSIFKIAPSRNFFTKLLLKNKPFQNFFLKKIHYKNCFLKKYISKLLPQERHFQNCSLKKFLSKKYIKTAHSRLLPKNTFSKFLPQNCSPKKHYPDI